MGYRLLIVDDEPLIRQGIGQLLDREALSLSEVLEAADGVEALSLIAEKHPRIVLADINMPRMDGLALARAIQQLDREIRVVIITGFDYFDYAVGALKAGVADFLLKPVSRSDVHELVRRLVAGLDEDEARRVALASLAEISRLEGTATAEDPEYRGRIRRVMDEHLSDPDFSLGVLARSINLSPGYLSGLYKDYFGMPFQDHLVALRLERAKILLLSTNRRVYEVAAEVGFDDPNYFSSRFRKQYGLSPNQYRGQVTGAGP